jgi:hypothetical protein
MKNMKFVVTATLVAVAIGVVACASRVNEREMNYLGSALTKVSAAVDAKVRYEPSLEKASSEDLLKSVAKDDPQLMRNFDGRVLRVLVTGEDSAVLLCESGPGRALLEDVGCTAKLDIHRWTMSGTQKCEFTLNPKQTCAD